MSYLQCPSFEILNYPHMKMPSALKLEISNFSLHPLGFDGDRSGSGHAFWLGGSLVEIGMIFSAIVCFPFFMVRSQVILNAVFGREEGGILFGRVFLISPSCIVSTSSWVAG